MEMILYHFNSVHTCVQIRTPSAICQKSEKAHKYHEESTDKSLKYNLGCDILQTRNLGGKRETWAKLT